MKKADRKKEHFRNEWKYLISTSEKEVLNLRMKPLMKLDPHAENGGISDTEPVFLMITGTVHMKKRKAAFL